MRLVVRDVCRGSTTEMMRRTVLWLLAVVVSGSLVTAWLVASKREQEVGFTQRTPTLDELAGKYVMTDGTLKWLADRYHHRFPVGSIALKQDQTFVTQQMPDFFYRSGRIADDLRPQRGIWSLAREGDGWSVQLRLEPGQVPVRLMIKGEESPYSLHFTVDAEASMDLRQVTH